MTTWVPFATTGPEPTIAGRLGGAGRRILLLHGGPGFTFEYLADLADELASENTVAWYQQRGLPPSSPNGPFSIADDVADAKRVLDTLAWDDACVVGHSWGGHLAMHLALDLPGRVNGVLAVDPLGSVGDGGWPEFDAEMGRRTPEAHRARAKELDELTTTGGATPELAVEGMRLVWPAYYADPASAPAMPAVTMSPECFAAMYASIQAELPALEPRLPEIRVPVGFVHGGASPMPIAASSDTAGRIPGAWVEVVEGAGHFIWYEAPGAVVRALRRLPASPVETETPT